MALTILRHRWVRVLATVLGVLVALVAAGLLVADSVILRKVRAEAEVLSKEWERPIGIDGLSVTLFTGAGARVTGLRVGAGPGESQPLLEVPQIRVRVALLRALFSFGKDVEVLALEVNGLRVNIERLADGTTNVERLQSQIAQSSPSAPPKPQPQPQSGPKDLSFLKVSRAALSEARITLVDRSSSGSHELRVDHLNAEVRDLRAGRPLTLRIQAAVLADQTNFELGLHSAPLPATLVPFPQRFTLEVRPIDLAPLAPFLPASVGLRGGRFQANLEAVLGDLLPGGSGPARIRGAIQASGLSFARQRGGRPVDAALEADLDAELAAGNVRIGKLRLDLGPAGLTGKGSASGLTGSSPRVEGLAIDSHDLDPALLATYYPPLRDLATRVSGPIGLSLRASGTQAKPVLELKADLTPVRLGFPDALAKAAGARAELVARLGGFGSEGLRVEADLNLVGVDLRPGGSLNKGPGDRMQLKLVATSRTKDRERKVDLSRLDLLLPGDEAVTAKGSATIGGTQQKREIRFQADLASDHLDLDRLMLPGEKEQKQQPSKPLDPKTFAGLSGEATARVALLRVKKADLRQIVFRIRVRDDELTIERGRLQAFGGEVTTDGTRARLAHPDDPFQLVAQGKGLDAGAAVGLFSSQKIVSGRFDGKVDLSGGGQNKAALVQTLLGIVDGNLSGGTFYGKDLVAGVAGPLAKALPFGSAGKMTQGGSTSLGKDLPFKLKFKNGAAQLEKPIQINSPDAGISIGGGFRLDGALDLAGTVALAPQTISRITGGRVQPQTPIPVAYRLTGPAWSPTLENLDLAPAVQAIVRQAGSAALGRALGGSAAPSSTAKQKVDDSGKKLEEEAKKKLPGLPGGLFK